VGAQVGAVRVSPVAGRADLTEWITFPRRAVYAPESSWVPPLDSDLRRLLDRRRNPFFRHGDAVALLARDERGTIVGRVLAHIYHRHNARYGERASFFGYFECQQSADAARALIAAAAACGARQGCTVLRGPFNMTAMQEMGILLDGFDAPPVVDETYTAPYYPALLAAAGLRPVFPVTTFCLDDVAAVNADALLSERHRVLLAGGRLRIRSADLRHFAAEIETLRELLNDSFYDNPSFVPITRDEFVFQIGPYRRLMDAEISLVAELDGVPVAFIVAVPDYNLLLKKLHGALGPGALVTFLRERRGIHDAALIIMGVQRQLQGQGVMRVMQAALIRALQRRDYRRLTITWVADLNAKSLATMQALGAQPYHRLTLYEGEIAALTP
jgi:RimJ/RimL family protein N-acetyltransferase